MYKCPSSLGPLLPHPGDHSEVTTLALRGPQRDWAPMVHPGHLLPSLPGPTSPLPCLCLPRSPPRSTTCLRSLSQGLLLASRPRAPVVVKLLRHAHACRAPRMCSCEGNRLVLDALTQVMLCRHLNQDLIILTAEFSFCIWDQHPYF